MARRSGAHVVFAQDQFPAPPRQLMTVTLRRQKVKYSCTETSTHKSRQNESPFHNYTRVKQKLSVAARIGRSYSTNQIVP